MGVPATSRDITAFEKLNAGDLEMWAFNNEMGKPGTGGTLVQMAGVPSGGNSVLVYFNCDDCAVEESRVVASQRPSAASEAARISSSLRA